MTINHPQPITLAACVVLTAGAFVAASTVEASAPPASWTAAAVLHDVDGGEVGTVTLAGDGAATVVTVALAGVTEGLGAFHGLHIHANDDAGTCDATADPVFSDVGGHWNPDGATHGHHAGDLPVVFVGADGAGSATATMRAFDPADLEGRAVILHAGPDNLANIPDRYQPVDSTAITGADEMTLATGDSGPRYGCGIIAVA